MKEMNSKKNMRIREEFKDEMHRLRVVWSEISR